MASTGTTSAPRAGSSQTPKARIAWVDWVRVLGAVAIVLLHAIVSTRIALGPSQVDVTRSVAWSLVEGLLCRWAVPAFMMLSGVLLLDPGRPFGWDRALRHAGRMLATILTFGLAFAVLQEGWEALSTGEAIDPAAVAYASVVDVVVMGSWDHLWYVYAMIPAYLLVPFLRGLRDQFGEKGLHRFAWALFALFLAIPFASSVVEVATGDASFVSPYEQGSVQCLMTSLSVTVTGMCLGDWLRGHLGDGKIVVGGVVASIAMAVVPVLLSGGPYEVISELALMHGSPLAMLAGMGAICLARRTAGDATIDADAPLARLGLDSFGVYVIHPLFIHLLVIFAPAGGMGIPVVWELSVTVIALIASVASVRILRRVPLLGRML